MRVTSVITGFIGALLGVGLSIAALVGAWIGNAAGGTIPAGAAVFALVMSLLALSCALAMFRHWRGAALLCALFGALGLLALPEHFVWAAVIMLIPAVLYAVSVLMERKNVPQALRSAVREAHSAFAQPGEALDFDEEAEDDAPSDAMRGETQEGAAAQMDNVVAFGGGVIDGGADITGAVGDSIFEREAVLQTFIDANANGDMPGHGDEPPAPDNVIDINEARVDGGRGGSRQRTNENHAADEGKSAEIAENEKRGTENSAIESAEIDELETAGEKLSGDGARIDHVSDGTQSDDDMQTIEHIEVDAPENAPDSEPGEGAVLQNSPNDLKTGETIDVPRETHEDNSLSGQVAREVLADVSGEGASEESPDAAPDTREARLDAEMNAAIDSADAASAELYAGDMVTARPETMLVIGAEQRAALPAQVEQQIASEQVEAEQADAHGNSINAQERQSKPDRHQKKAQKRREKKSGANSSAENGAENEKHGRGERSRQLKK